MTPREERRLQYALALAAIIGWLVVAPKVPTTVDEGQHLVGGRYMLLDSSYMVRHHRLVGEQESWEHEASTYWTYPPTIDATYALSTRIFGMNAWANGFPLLLCAAIATLALAMLARRLAGSTGVLLAIALVPWSHAALSLGLMIECEPFVAALGTLGVALAVEALYRQRVAWAAGAGAALGLAFLYKVWLAAPLVAATGLVLLYAGPVVLDRRAVAKYIIITAGAFLVVGTSHLVFISLVRPSDLVFWMRIYLAPFMHDSPASQHQPWWFYGAALYRELWPLAPALLIFVVHAWRTRREATLERRIERALFVAALLGLALLQTSSKKEALYLYSIIPLVGLLAIVGVSVLVTARSEVPRWTWVAAGATYAGLAAAVWWVASKTASSPVSPQAHAVVACALGTALAVSGKREKWIAAAVVMASVAWGLTEAASRVRERLDDDVTPVAHWAAPNEEPTPRSRGSREPAFISPYWLPMSYYTWQHGRPWWLEADASTAANVIAQIESTVRWVQIEKTFTPRLGGPPDARTHGELVAWLRANAQDETPAIERAAGRPLSTYVFKIRTAPR